MYIYADQALCDRHELGGSGESKVVVYMYSTITCTRTRAQLQGVKQATPLNFY